MCVCVCVQLFTKAVTYDRMHLMSLVILHTKVSLKLPIGVNCGNYDVHVLSTFEGNGDIISWNDVLSTGDINVVISVSGTGNRSLVLVLLNHYPLNWILDIPNGVVIEKILLVSAFLS